MVDMDPFIGDELTTFTQCSISDHMYRMAILSMLTTDQSLDVSKLVCFLLLLEPKRTQASASILFPNRGRCVMMALVHDLAEAQVGDITPYENFTKEEKHRLEQVRLPDGL